MSQPSEISSHLSARIATVRGKRVLLDSDLGALYGVSTMRFNEAVKRNLDRFPDDFAFVPSNQEVANLKSQFAISSFRAGGHGGREQRRNTPSPRLPRTISSRSRRRDAKTIRPGARSNLGPNGPDTTPKLI